MVRRQPPPRGWLSDGHLPGRDILAGFRRGREPPPGIPVGRCQIPFLARPIPRQATRRPLVPGARPALPVVVRRSTAVAFRQSRFGRFSAFPAPGEARLSGRCDPEEALLVEQAVERVDRGFTRGRPAAAGRNSERRARPRFASRRHRNRTLSFRGPRSLSAQPPADPSPLRERALSPGHGARRSVGGRTGCGSTWRSAAATGSRRRS